MKGASYIITTFLLFFMLADCHAQNNQGEASVLGVYVASTPCSAPSKPLPGMPPNAACELMKWKLTFYANANNKTPTTFKLHCVYGLSKQGTKGFTGGGTEINLEGNWIISKGTTGDPAATVYRLTDGTTNKVISLIRLSNDVLHLLDDAQHLMIGTAAWSFTLNKIANQ